MPSAKSSIIATIKEDLTGHHKKFLRSTGDLAEDALIDAISKILNVNVLDFVEFIKQCGDVTGWPMDDIIVPMTPEDQQRQMMMNPAVVNAQAKQQQQQQQHQDDLENIQAKGEASAGVQVVRHVLKGAEDEASREHELKMLAKPLANQGPNGQ